MFRRGTRDERAGTCGEINPTGYIRLSLALLARRFAYKHSNLYSSSYPVKTWLSLHQWRKEHPRTLSSN